MNENLTTPLDKEAGPAEMTKSIVSTAIAKVKAKRASVVIKDGFAILDNYFRLDEGTYKILKRNINKGVSSLLLGPTGVGKTELVAALAATEGLPLTIFDMGTMTDPIMSLVGTHTIKVKGGVTESKFAMSRFSQVIQKPGVILLDELSRASAQANNLLFPVLDFRKELSMEYSFDNYQPIKVHPKCIFFATANTGSQYTGTHRLDRALVDRFMLVEVDPLLEAQIKDIVKYHYPKVSQAKIDKMTACYMAINKAHEDYSIPFNLSLRHLKMIASMVEDGFTIYDSFYTICKGIGSKDGLKSLEAILKETQK